MKVSLVVAQGPKQGTAIPVSKAEFVIGRDAGCNLRPASQAVSKRHCSISLRNDQAFAQDLKSTNGTFVNKEKLTGERELRDGDLLNVGPLTFTVKIETATQPAPMPKPRPSVPAPTPIPAPVSGEPLDEDAIGSMLLTLSEEGEPVPPKEDDLDGTTIMEMLKPDEAKRLEDANPYRPPAKAAAEHDTNTAAKQILEKYRRRPRS